MKKETSTEDIVVEKPFDRSEEKFWLKASVYFLIETLFMVLTSSLVWAKSFYGNINIENILFHLFGPVGETADYILRSYISTVITLTLPVVLITIIIIFSSRKFKKFGSKKKNKSKWTVAFYIAWLIALISFTCHAFGVLEWVQMQLIHSNFIEEEYADPDSVNITFPEQKRNLICIFIESAETTNMDHQNGGSFNTNYSPEMTELAKNNVSFSHSDKLEGATVPPACGWTIAGLVAETSGLPLKLYKYSNTDVDNAMEKYDYFLPGATTIGDILYQEGYKNYFMAGSDFDFGGRTNYFVNHGNYEIFDYYTAIETGKIPETYMEWWGFEDQKLYSYAKEKILELAQSDQPFNFSMLTADTHQENGYPCQLCVNHHDDQYANVWRCASTQLNDFVNWCKEQDFYENTTIVIVGDHCSMDSDFYGMLNTTDKHHGTVDRKIYNCFINSAVQPTEKQEHNRMFTTMDYFPTILASLGVEIEGNRLGLGTNLFSDEQTLAEKYGYDDMFYEIGCRSDFYNHELFMPKE